MYIVAQLNRSARLVATLCAPLALAGMFMPSAASAQTEETSEIDNNYGTAFPPLAPVSTSGGSNVTIYSGSYAQNAESELGLNYTATVDKDTGGFFFLHDNYCVGMCNTVSDTTITFNVTNKNDGGEQDIWFHSQITPGHLAEIYNGGLAGATAGFNFTVSRVGFETPLYSAWGTVGRGGIELNTGDLIYNGLSSVDGANDVVVGDNYKLLDWQTTNLSINAGSLLFNETMQIEYRATYWSSGQAACADVFVCPGVQVVFGDPRNNGGISVSSFAFDAPPSAPPLAVIGADYGAFFVPYEFNNSSMAPDRFGQPGGEDPLIYDQLYRSREAVPEPESWALMILGFGAAGAAMRRQRSRSRMVNA